MTPERYQQVNSLLDDVLELSPEERAAHLSAACGGDEELRREVESLLQSHDQAHSFIKTLVAAEAKGLLGEQRNGEMIGRTLGHYQLRSLLGAGGMGEVYRATDPRLERDVAVKILPTHLSLDDEARRRFQREAKVVAALSHPNICAIYDYGIEQGVTFMVMELLEGATLRAHLARSVLPWREATEIGMAVANGLAAAHVKGIIHRDLKPENIFLTTDEQVKILDFGIAHINRIVSPEAETGSPTTTQTTRPGTVIGTVGYMSPEQVRGEKVEATSDIFSLGCVLYEMVSGRRPFTRNNSMETLAATLTEDPPVLAETGKGIPRQLEQVIRHCLEKQPASRYQSARDLVQDLRAIFSESGQPISAPRIKRRRFRPAVILTASLILCAMIALSVYLFIGREKAIDSIAILPLVNASGDANLEYLSDGITEKLINTLSQLPQLRVMARGTVFTYKGKEIDPRKVGQELGVRAVFTGTMVQRGDTLSIRADLVNAGDGSQLWSESYNRSLSDLLTIQEEITRHISESLRLKLSVSERQRLTKTETTNIEARQLCFKGKYYLYRANKGGLTEALHFFRMAIDADPSYASAHALMAHTYVYLADDNMPSKEAIAKAKKATENALKLDDTLAEAYVALALIKFQYDWEWVEAEQAFKQALKFNQGDATTLNLYGNYLVEMGRFAEAQKQMDHAYLLDPLTGYIQVGAIMPVLFAGQYNQAIDRLRGIINLEKDFSNAHLQLGSAYVFNGMYDEGLASLQKARSINEWPITLAALGYAYAKAGQREEAQKLLVEVQERARLGKGSEYYVAVAYAGLGDKDQAIAALEKAYLLRDTNLIYLKVDPYFVSLRADPRFSKLLRQMNFPNVS